MSTLPRPWLITHRNIAYRTNLLAVNTPVIRLDDDEALASDVQTGALDLLDVGRVLVSGDDFLHFGGRDGEAGAGGPDAVAGVVEDGGAVDVAGADEAGRVGGLVWDVGGGGTSLCGVPGVNVCCAWRWLAGLIPLVCARERVEARRSGWWMD